MDFCFTLQSPRHMHSLQLFTGSFWNLPFCALTHSDSTCKQSVRVSRQGFRKVRLLMYADHLRSSTYTYLLSSCIYSFFLVTVKDTFFNTLWTLGRKSCRFVNIDTHSFDLINGIELNDHSLQNLYVHCILKCETLLQNSVTAKAYKSSIIQEFK